MDRFRSLRRVRGPSLPVRPPRPDRKAQDEMIAAIAANPALFFGSDHGIFHVDDGSTPNGLAAAIVSYCDTLLVCNGSPVTYNDAICSSNTEGYIINGQLRTVQIKRAEYPELVGYQIFIPGMHLRASHSGMVRSIVLVSKAQKMWLFCNRTPQEVFLTNDTELSIEEWKIAILARKTPHD